MSFICMICFYFWCSNNSVQSMCFSNSGNVPSAKEIVYFKNGDKLNMRLNLTGVPHNADNYEVWMRGANTYETYSISLKQDTISTKFITFEKDLREYYISSDIIIQIYTRYKKELICVNQLPFKLSAVRKKTTALKHPCVSPEGCTCNIGITCNNVNHTGSPPPPPPVTTTTENNFHNNVLTLTSGDKSKETELIYKSDGEKITLFCKSDEPKMFLKWDHTKDNGDILTEFTGNFDQNLGVELTIHLFDNNTNLICYAYASDNSFEVVASSKIIKIIVLNRTIDKNNQKKSNLTERVENHNTSVCLKQIITLDCHAFNKSRANFIYWLEQRWKNYTNKYNDKESFEISEEQINSQFICLAYLGREKNQLWERKIQRIQTFHFSSNEKCKTVIQYPELSFEEPNAGNRQLLIYGSVAGAVMILSALLFGCFWFHRKKQSNPHQVDTYANLRVQYADLAILGSDTTRTLQREESPYAEIIGFMGPKNN